MKPKWVIEDFEPDNSFGILAEEVKRQGMEVEVIKYAPFESGTYKIFENQCVLFQGSLNLARQAMQEIKWYPGPWLTAENYECTKYYVPLGKYLFNDQYIMLPVGEIPRRTEWLYNVAFGGHDHLFFRPSSGLKTFTAKLMDREALKTEWDWIKEFTNPEDIVVVSTPKNIQAEWRMVCYKDGVVAGCQYKKNGRSVRQAGYPEAVEAIATDVAKAYVPDPMFIVDICQGADDAYYLLEINSFSCGGLYACEMAPIVAKASDLASAAWTKHMSNA